MSEIILIAYIFIFVVAAVLLFAASKLANLAKELENTLADKEDRILKLEVNAVLAQRSIKKLNEKIKEGDKQ